MGLWWLQCSLVELRCAQPAANDQKELCLCGLWCAAVSSILVWVRNNLFRFQVGILWLPQVSVVGFLEPCRLGKFRLLG